MAMGPSKRTPAKKATRNTRKPKKLTALGKQLREEGRKISAEKRANPKKMRGGGMVKKMRAGGAVKKKK